ncbi:MAG TPA: hypothetical protein VMX55_08125 [candidate division Zixibacteria bacterium]|nr:hypothetical protein [candidate division Zixibacteria bacterium]
MTVRGKHLQCDGRSVCISCSIYTWPPKVAQPKKYYYCENCKTDILCERGLSSSYDYYDDGFVDKKFKCVKCDGLLLEIIWPRIPEKLEKELLKLD